MKLFVIVEEELRQKLGVQYLKDYGGCKPVVELEGKDEFELMQKLEHELGNTVMPYLAEGFHNIERWYSV